MSESAPVPMFSPNGNLGEALPENVGLALQNGWTRATPEQVAASLHQDALRERQQGVGAGLETAATAARSALTFGGSDWLQKYLDTYGPTEVGKSIIRQGFGSLGHLTDINPDNFPSPGESTVTSENNTRAEVNPIYHGIGTGAGVLLPALVSGGASLATAPGLIAGAGKLAGGGVGAGLARLGAAPLAGKLIGAAADVGLQGGLYAAGDINHEAAALDKPAFTAENLGRVGLSAALGAGLGAGGSALGSMASAVAPGAVKVLGDIQGSMYAKALGVAKPSADMLADLKQAGDLGIITPFTDAARVGEKAGAFVAKSDEQMQAVLDGYGNKVGQDILPHRGILRQPDLIEGGAERVADKAIMNMPGFNYLLPRGMPEHDYAANWFAASAGHPVGDVLANFIDNHLPPVALTNDVPFANAFKLALDLKALGTPEGIEAGLGVRKLIGENIAARGSSPLQLAWKNLEENNALADRVAKTASFATSGGTKTGAGPLSAGEGVIAGSLLSHLVAHPGVGALAGLGAMATRGALKAYGPDVAAGLAGGLKRVIQGFPKEPLEAIATGGGGKALADTLAAGEASGKLSKFSDYITNNIDPAHLEQRAQAYSDAVESKAHAEAELDALSRDEGTLPEDVANVEALRDHYHQIMWENHPKNLDLLKHGLTPIGLGNMDDFGRLETMKALQNPSSLAAIPQAASNEAAKAAARGAANDENAPETPAVIQRQSAPPPPVSPQSATALSTLQRATEKAGEAMSSAAEAVFTGDIPAALRAGAPATFSTIVERMDLVRGLAANPMKTTGEVTAHLSDAYEHAPNAAQGAMTMIQKSVGYLAANLPETRSPSITDHKPGQPSKASAYRWNDIYEAATEPARALANNPSDAVIAALQVMHPEALQVAQQAALASLAMAETVTQQQLARLQTLFAGLPITPSESLPAASALIPLAETKIAGPLKHVRAMKAANHSLASRRRRDLSSDEA